MNRQETMLTSRDETGHKSGSGEKGVSQETVGSGKDRDPNNFADGKDRVSAAGKKGGHPSH